LFAKIKRITDGKREDGSIAASNPSRAGNFELTCCAQGRLGTSRLRVKWAPLTWPRNARSVEVALLGISSQTTTR